MASTPLMMWNCVSTVPSTFSTALTGLSAPVELTMTVSVVLAWAAGVATADVPAIRASAAAPAAAS